MRNTFPGFYSPLENDIDAAWKSENTLFVFDTNTLLNLYGYAEQTRNDFFSILEVLTSKIWIPYHVGLEYQRRRLSIIRDEKAVFKKVEDLLSKIDKIFETDFKAHALSRRFPTLNSNTEKLHSEIKKLISAYKKSLTHWDKKQPGVRGHDSIREKFDLIFEGKIGKIPKKQESLNTIFKDGEVRYKNNVPPGYKDIDKSKGKNEKFIYGGLEYESQYGDLLIWKQLIDKSKEEKVKNVIFVTDDAKEDWWYIIDSRGEKNIGPRAELREEIYREANIELFTMYNTSGFLNSGKKLLEVDVRDESIDDANNAFLNQPKWITYSHNGLNGKFVTNKEFYDSLKGLNALQNSFSKISNNSDWYNSLRTEEINSLLEQFKAADKEKMNDPEFQHQWNALAQNNALSGVQELVKFLEEKNKFSDESDNKDKK